MNCPNCGYDGESKEPLEGGWIVSHDLVGMVQIEEWRCPLCRSVVQTKEYTLDGNTQREQV